MTTLSKSAFAVVMGVDRAQPTRWEQLGMPTLPGGKVDPVKAAAWVRANIDPRQRESRTGTARPGDLLQERVRVARSQADAQEMANDVRRKEVVEVADVATLVGSEYAKVRTRLLSIPAEHAARLARLQTPVQVQDALQGLLTAALEELTQDAVYPQPAPPIRRTLAEERTRVARAQADALERNNRVQEGELVELTLAQSVMFDTFRECRDAWLNWPVVTGPLIATDLGIDPEKLTLLLVEHVHRQLTALGEPEADFTEGNARA